MIAIKAGLLGLLMLWAPFYLSLSSARDHHAREKFGIEKTASAREIYELEPKCRFVISELQGGSYFGPERGNAEAGSVFFDLAGAGKWNFEIPLSCTLAERKHDYPGLVSADEIDFWLAAKQINGKWIPNDGRKKNCDSTRFAEADRRLVDTGESCFYPEERFKVFDLQGKNWRGRATLRDVVLDSTVKFRMQRFSYCLVQNGTTNMLCGSTNFGGRIKPRRDLLSMVMKVLVSIEFVELPSKPQ